MFADGKHEFDMLMNINKRIIVAFVFCSLPAIVFAQSPGKTREQIEMEAKAKEKADAEARAKAREEAIKKMKEAQAKAEHNQTKMREAAAASVNAKADAFYSMAMSQINEKYITWVKENAKKINDENLDGLAFKIMANYYGKKEGLSQIAIDGLQVLLLRETYLIGKNEFRNYLKSTQVTEERISNLVTAQQLLSDSSNEVNRAQLDSINILLNTSETTKTENRYQQETRQTTGNAQKPEITTRKEQVSTVSISALTLTKMKLAEKITDLNGMGEEQALRMQQITLRQQKITQMLSTIVNQVTDSKEAIIKNLK